MKVLMVSLFLVFSSALCAQTPTKQKLYTAKIITVKDTITAALLECTDSTIAVVDMKIAKASINPDYHEIQVIPITDLIHIKIRRTGAIRRTALTLGIIGGLTGAIAGLAGRPDEEDIYGGVIDTFSAGYYAVQGALIGVTIGGAIGVVAGSGSKKFSINRQPDAYQTHKAELAKYLYKPKY